MFKAQRRLSGNTNNPPINRN